MSGINNLIEDAKTLKAPVALSREDRPFRAMWRDVVFFAIDPYAEVPEGEGPKVLTLPPNEAELRKQVGFLYAIVERSNHRDFAEHRTTFGTVFEGGRFLPCFHPAVLGRSSGAPYADNTFAALHDLMVHVKEWQDAFLASQHEEYIERKSAPVIREDKFNKPQKVMRVGKTERSKNKGKAPVAKST